MAIPEGGARPSRPRNDSAVVLLGLLVAALLLVHFHDQYWYPHDEGIYAHVAERVASGEVLHRDIQDIHPGYGAFISAAALRLFGASFVSMRYPLVLAGLLAAVFAAALLRDRGPARMAIGAVIVTCLGWPLFLGPSPSWYTIPLFLAAPLVLEDRMRPTPGRMMLGGIMVAIAFLLRQLNGVILGVAVASWLLGGAPDPSPAPAARSGFPLGRGLLVTMLVGSAVYSLFASDSVGWLLFGIGPLAAIVLAMAQPPLPTGEALRRCGWCAVGAAIGAAPMAIYVLLTDSWSWFHTDVFGAALSLPSMEFFETRSYATFLVLGVLGVGLLKPGTVLAGLFWLWLLLAPLGLACRTVARWFQGRFATGSGAIAHFALVGGLLAVHYPSVLYVGGPAVLTAVAWLKVSRARPWTLTGLAALLATYVIVWQGGRRPYLFGQEIVTNARWEEAKGALRIDPAIRAEYADLLGELRDHVAPGEPIFSFPAHAEFYFLLGSPNPTKFYSLALARLDEAHLKSLLAEFERNPPRAVVYDPRDPHHVPEAVHIMRWATPRAERIERIHGFYIYYLPRAESGKPSGK